MKSFFEKPTLMHIMQSEPLSTYITYITLVREATYIAFKHFLTNSLHIHVQYTLNT